jgi:type IV pilus assembly protein PilE
MKNQILSKKLPAFTLTELLVVLVIIGILVLLALPKLLPVVNKAKSSSSLEDIGFEQEKLTTEGGTANYRIEIIEASTTGFKARATAVVDFNGNGKFNVWEIDQDKNLVEVTKN